MPYRLLRFAFSKKYPEPRMFREPAKLKDSYEVVIIGGGGHGLGAAYYLAKDYGITDIAVLEKGYIGGGNTGRNTAIVRSNYLTVEGVKFYDECQALATHLPGNFDPIHFGQHHVQHHQVMAAAFSAGQARQAIVRDLNAVADVGQRPLYDARDSRIVFNQQNIHCSNHKHHTAL